MPDARPHVEGEVLNPSIDCLHGRSESFLREALLPGPRHIERLPDVIICC
jgi:hypothetical protein